MIGTDDIIIGLVGAGFIGIAIICCFEKSRNIFLAILAYVCKGLFWFLDDM